MKKYNYYPKTKEELKQTIYALIEERGNKADLNDIDVSGITDMSEVFRESEFNGNVSKWNVSNVQNMAGMFAYSKFNGDISKWDTSNVQNMNWMFIGSPLEKNPPKWYKE